MPTTTTTRRKTAEAVPRTKAKVAATATITPMPPAPPKAVGGKLGVLLTLLQRPQGATIEAMTKATGWQAHSVRGAMSGALKKDRNIIINSEATEQGRVYKAQGEAGV